MMLRNAIYSVLFFQVVVIFVHQSIGNDDDIKNLMLVENFFYVEGR